MRIPGRFFGLVVGVLLLIGGGWPSVGSAQQFVSGPSVGVDDAKSLLRNPATATFHRSQIALGAKAHHLGLGSDSGAPLRQGFFAASTPYLVGGWLGGGATVRYIDTPIFKKRAFGASVSGRFFRMFSVGARVSALNLSFNRSEFVGVGSDPVFEGGTGKTVLTGTLGLFAKPLPDLNVALGARNLNRPDLSLGGGEFRAEPEFFGGVSYAVGFVRGRAEVVTGRYGVDLRAALEAYTMDGSYVRLGSDASFNNARVEGQLHVGGPVSANYQYTLPTSSLQNATSGSHQFSVIYEFGRAPEPPEMPEPPSMLLGAERKSVEPSWTPSLSVSSPYETVQHLEKRVEREINVPQEVVQSVSREALGRPDSSFADSRGRTQGHSPGDVPEHVKIADVLTARYDSTFGKLGQRLREGSPKTLQVLKNRRDSAKAFGMYNRLREVEGVQAGQVQVMVPKDSTVAQPRQDSLRLPDTEQVSILNPKRTSLTLLYPYLEAEEGVWRVVIEDRSGSTVRTFSGTGRPPGQIEWAWTDEEGEPLDQGRYVYFLAWEGLDGTTYQSKEREFAIHKTIRKVTIEVTQQPGVLEDRSDAIELRMENE